MLDRGEYQSPTEEVHASLPAFLPPLPEGEKMNRLGLARWLVSQDQPLTARVQVNHQSSIGSYLRHRFGGHQ